MTLSKLIDLQIKMHLCPAPGMGTIDVFLFHLLNGTNGIFYKGECEKECIADNENIKKTHDHSFNAAFQYRPMFRCLEKWHKLYHLERWHAEQVKIPGVWIMPGNDEVVIKNGYPPLCDDITSFGAGAPRFLNSFDEIPGNVLIGPDRHVAHTEGFRKRFNTSLLLHQGGGGRYDYDLFLPQDISKIFPNLQYVEEKRKVRTDFSLSPIDKDWNFTLSTFVDVHQTNKVLD